MSARFDAGDRGDVQSLLGSALASLRDCRYGLLTVRDAAAARAWIASLLDSGLLRSVADLGAQRPEVAALAISWRGLRALDVREHADFPFPTAFRAGMGSRLLGAVRRAPWTWSDDSVDLLLVHYRAMPMPQQPSALPPPDSPGSGLDATWVATCPSYIQRVDDNGRTAWGAYEPFGFRDGIAQPVVEGLTSDAATQRARERAGALYADRVVAGGEFVLGHPNEYGELAYCPDVIGWPAASRAGRPMSRFGLNGSYLAVQQIRQDVQAFRDFESRRAGGNGASPSLAERMIGRRKDGSPLVGRPESVTDIDAFRYRLADCEGFQCPRGAHVRRANPRDMLGEDSASGIAAAKLHRLLRRARVYSDGAACGQWHPCGDDRNRDGCGRGLFFMALNADLERQFEFVQQRWIDNPHFNDLVDETDPLLGGEARRSFALPALPLGSRANGLPRFTETIGGGYFFLPSLAALRFIAA